MELMISRKDELDSGVVGHRRNIETQTSRSSLTELLSGALPDPPSAPPDKHYEGELAIRGPLNNGLQELSNGHQSLPNQEQSLLKRPPPSYESIATGGTPESETVNTPDTIYNSTRKTPLMASMETRFHEGTPLRASYRQALGRNSSDSTQT